MLPAGGRQLLGAGTGVSKDVWMLGIGLNRLADEG
jgi:hypothetical protein